VKDAHARKLLLLALLVAAGCGSGASTSHGQGAAGSSAAGASGSSGVGAAGASAGASGSNGAGAAGSSLVGNGAGGSAGESAGAGGTTPVAGSGGGAGSAGSGGSGGGSGGMAGAAGATAGAAGTAIVMTGAAGGTFAMCDDHADFNGRGLCAPTGKFGAVVATQTLSAGGALTTLTASFAASKPATDPGCTQEAAGTGCLAVTCPAGARNSAGPEAGAITAKSNGGTIVTKPDASGAYDVAGLASALWSQAKAALTFSAAGGAVPAFSETFCGPPSATITKPTAAPGAGLTIDRTSDLALQWTGGAVGDLEIVLRDDTAAAGSRLEVRCSFTGSAGQGTIPKAALAKMSAGTHTVASSIWVRKISLPQGTCVELTGVNTSVSSTGAPWNGSAVFQ
jgi:hypothetical protein